MTTAQHKRYRQKKISEFLEYTDKSKEFQVKNQYVVGNIEKDIKYFKPIKLE